MKVMVDLDELQGKLADARQRITDLTEELREEHTRARNIDELIQLMDRMYGSNPDASSNTLQPIAPEEPAAPTADLSLSASDFMAMDTKAAAMSVLRESGRPWQIKELTEEMLRRGWQPRSGSDNPFSAVSTAVNRLSKLNENVVRPRYGWYAWKSQQPVAAEGRVVVSGSAELGGSRL